MTDASTATPIRDAATVILVRDADTRPRVLVGRRGSRAAFMPDKFVFPGGAVDPADAEVPLSRPPGPGLPLAIVGAAIRELWEETGLMLAEPARPGAPDLPPPWNAFSARNARPSAEGMTLVFRAITPPGRPRRFDARFLLVDGAHVLGDPDDFSAAGDELSDLHWAPLDRVRELDLPFITEVVLAEVAARLAGAADDGIPFFDNSGPRPVFRRIPLSA